MLLKTCINPSRSNKNPIYLQVALVTLSFESIKEVLNYELSLSVATQVYDYF